MTAIAASIFRYDQEFAAGIVGYRANPSAAAAETPLTLDAHQGPRAVADFLIVPWAAQKIIPA